MKSPPSPDDLSATDPDIRTRIAGQYQLSAEAVEKIFEVMNANRMSFPDAALHLGFIRRQDIPQGEMPHAGGNGTAAVGLIETAINRISTKREVVVRQGPEVTPGAKLQIAFDKTNPRNEKMRALRTELLLMNETSNAANIMAVLSPGRGEGRSQLCAELAISFAQLGRRTLLVDADMRSPQQHVLFGSNNQLGLAQAITLNMRPLLHPVKGLAQMFLLTAGIVPSNPLELLSDGRYEKLVTDWRNGYEFVVIDTPPVSHYSDALAVATLAGRVIILSRAKMTSYKNTRDMLRRLETTRAQVLGGIINHF